MRPQPLICVRDVEASSRWYQRLRNCQEIMATARSSWLVAGSPRTTAIRCWPFPTKSVA